MERRLIAERDLRHRGRLVPVGTEFSATSTEAKTLLARKMARKAPPSAGTQTTTPDRNVDAPVLLSTDTHIADETPAPARRKLTREMVADRDASSIPSDPSAQPFKLTRENMTTTPTPDESKRDDDTPQTSTTTERDSGTSTADAPSTTTSDPSPETISSDAPGTSSGSDNAPA